MSENIKKKIGILASGNGSNIPSLLKSIQANTLNAEIVLLLSNKANCGAIEMATKFGIQAKGFNPDIFNSKEDFDSTLVREFWNNKVDLILLCGYTRVLSLPIIKAYENRIINTHPSLLPAFGGKGMYGNKVHQAAIDRGVKFSGCSVHIVTENIDEGPILGQKVVELDDFETVDSLKSKVMQAEEILYPEATAKYALTLPELNFAQLPYCLQEEGSSASEPAPTFFDDKQKEYAYEKADKKGYAICDLGLRRKENADTVLLTSDLRLMGVADGIGSAKEGKQTSRMIMSFLGKKWAQDVSLNKIQGINLASWIKQAAVEANHQILNWAKQSPNRVDIGSTLVTGIFDEAYKNLFIANVGDSRAYVWRSGVLYRLTRDHSEDYDPETGDGGALIYYMGGIQNSFGVDVFHLEIFPGDRIIMCSDGLLFATEEKMVERLKQNLSLPELGKVFVADAYEVGAPDNIGISMMQV